MIYVVEVHDGPNGLQADLPDQVQGPDDLDHVGSLEGFETRSEEVDFDGIRKRVTVYRSAGVAYVKLEDCPAPDPDS